MIYNMFEIITYATHSQGMFEELINNKFNVPINVLGFGDRWINYMQKFNSILKYIETLDPEKIIIFLDGFDTKISKDPKLAVFLFMKLGYTDKVLFSSDVGRNRHGFISYVDRLLTSISFPNSCNEKEYKYINSGMYMGRAKNVHYILNKIILNSYGEVDDQKNINKNCSILKHKIVVDQDEHIFQNRKFNLYNKSSSPIFLSYPMSGGTDKFDSIQSIKLSISRMLRMACEHSIIFLFLFLFIFCIMVVFRAIVKNIL